MELEVREVAGVVTLDVEEKEAEEDVEGKEFEEDVEGIDVGGLLEEDTEEVEDRLVDTEEPLVLEIDVLMVDDGALVDVTEPVDEVPLMEKALVDPVKVELGEVKSVAELDDKDPEEELVPELGALVLEVAVVVREPELVTDTEVDEDPELFTEGLLEALEEPLDPKLEDADAVPLEAVPV